MVYTVLVDSEDKMTIHNATKIKELKEFKEISERKNVKLGIDIINTFGRIKKHVFTDFSTPLLNL